MPGSPLDPRTKGSNQLIRDGDNKVSRLDLSIDFGVTWIQAKLDAPSNPYAWRRFSQTVRLPRQDSEDRKLILDHLSTTFGIEARPRSRRG